MKEEEESEVQVRWLKVSRLFQLRSARYCHIILPSLLITGKWFENAGFAPYDHVSITVEHEKLVIEKIVEED